MLAKINSVTLVGLNAVPVEVEVDVLNQGLPALKEIRTRVQKARDIQTKRFKKEKIVSNSEMSSKLISKYCILTKESEDILKMAIEKLNLSTRSYNKILKIGRTIADLENKKDIEPKHITEALQYRPKIDTI